MKNILLILTLALLVSCKQNKPTVDNSTTETSTPKDEVLIKESLFLTMERTPCFGKCPSYKLSIFNTGNVVYEGFTFAKKEGKHTKTLSKKQLTEIQDQIEAINLFEMNDKYASKITDIPSTILYVVYNGKKKKILDRVGGPDELKRFEKLIDFLVIDDELKKESE
jgi:Domain of unknown function (DUF6438)